MGFLSSLFGGDESNSSTSSNSTSNQTAYNTDKRNVASDAAISLSGDGNTIDRSTSNLTQFFDASNRSTNFSDTSNRSTTFTDNSDRSTAFQSLANSNNTTIFTDNSDRSVVSTVTDYGSVNASVGLASALSTKAFDTAALLSGQATGLAGVSIKGAIDNLMKQSETGLEATKLAFDMVRSSGANNMASSAAVLGMAQNAIEKTAGAFQEASDGGEKKTIMYAIGAVAVIAVAFAMNR
jgi:hypothetical protein